MNSNSLPYRIRQNPRAKHVQIKVEFNGDVVVVLPRFYRNLNVPELIEKHQSWIEKIRAKYLANRQHDPLLCDPVPARVQLALLKRSWEIDYCEEPVTSSATFNEYEDMLRLVAENTVQAQDMLKRWLHRKAKEQLTPWLYELAGQYGFEVNKVYIKAQKTRWGSCSTQCNINLNRNIMFLNRDQARYLLIHELCHLSHMNHSKRYWALVAKFEPNYRSLESEINKAHNVIPLWAMN